MRRAIAVLYVLLCLAWGGGVAAVLGTQAQWSALPDPATVPDGTPEVTLSAAQLDGRAVILPPQPYLTPRTAAEWRALTREAERPRLVRDAALAALIAALALSVPLAIAVLAGIARRFSRPPAPPDAALPT